MGTRKGGSNVYQKYMFKANKNNGTFSTKIVENQVNEKVYREVGRISQFLAKTSRWTGST